MAQRILKYFLLAIISAVISFRYLANVMSIDAIMPILERSLLVVIFLADTYLVFKIFNSNQSKKIKLLQYILNVMVIVCLLLIIQKLQYPISLDKYNRVIEDRFITGERIDLLRGRGDLFETGSHGGDAIFFTVGTLFHNFFMLALNSLFSRVFERFFVSGAIKR